MKPHYVGSIAYDNEQGEWEDDVIMGRAYNEFIQDLKNRMVKRKNSEVFFATTVDNRGREYDITNKVKEDCS